MTLAGTVIGFYCTSSDVTGVIRAPTCSSSQQRRDRKKSLSADQPWHALPVQIWTQRQSGVLPPCCIPTFTLHLTGRCQSMPQITGNYYLQSPRRENGLTQPGRSTSHLFWTESPQKCVFLPNVQSSSPPVCHCGSEAARGAERLSLSVFLKAERINGLPVWPSHALCTTQLLCIVVGLMLLTSIF